MQRRRKTGRRGMTRRRVGVAALVALLLLGLRSDPASAATGAPTVVTSIMPVHSLVAGVMAGIGQPRVIVTNAGSPHTYALKPSDARLLGRAAIVFWIGPTVEAFLEKPIRVLTKGARVVTLLEAPGLTLLPLRSSDRGAIDPHIWLDPVNAGVLAGVIARALGDVDAGNRMRYAANARNLVRRLKALEAELRDRLRPVRDRPMVVFHDAYQYFEKRFGLRAVTAITPSPQHRPGAGRLGEVRQAIETSGTRCVFTEPQFGASVLRPLTEGTGAKSATLDPLGRGLEAGPDLYFELLRRNASSIIDCMTAKGRPGK